MSTLGISATIITKNEELNLPRAIKSLESWVDEIVVVDSGSTDKTCEIAETMGARVIQQTWLGYGQQKNLAQSHTEHPWVVNIDADEEITPDLAKEIQHELAHAPPNLTGFLIPRKTFYLGKWIRHGGWYPNYVSRIVKKEHGNWTEPTLHETLVVKGDTKKLRNPMNHYTFGSIEDQVRTNIRYAKEGAQGLFERGVQPSLFKLVFKPIGKFLETYFWKLGFMDGRAGFIISLNAAHSMLMRQAFLWEKRRRESSRH